MQQVVPGDEQKKEMEMMWMNFRNGCLAVILVIALAGTVGASDPIRFVLTSAQGLPGDTVTIPIRLFNVTNVANMDLTFGHYGASCAPFYTVTSIEKGSLTQGSFFDWKATADDTAKISLVSSQPITGSGTVAVVTVKVKSTAGQNGKNPCYFTIGGDFFDSKGKLVGFHNTGATFTLAANIKGDGNHDGKVDTNDALAALQMAVGKTKVNLVYDMNGDNEVNARDVREILKLTVTSTTVMEMPAQINDSAKSGSMQKWKP